MLALVVVSCATALARWAARPLVPPRRVVSSIIDLDAERRARGGKRRKRPAPPVRPAWLWILGNRNHRSLRKLLKLTERG